MSKFFEESRNPGQSSTADSPAKTVDHKLDELLSTFKIGSVDRDVEGVQVSVAVPENEPTQVNGDYRQVDLSLSERLLGRSDNETAMIAADAYRMLRTRLLRLLASRGQRSVVISSAVQGEGKTVTTMNLGICCSQLRDTQVLLVDGDLRNTGLTRLVATPEGLGLSDALSGKVRFEECVAKTDFENLFIVCAGSPTDAPAELIAGPNWKRFMQWATDKFKLVLVDSPPVLALADFELLAAGCDALLTVVRSRTTQREVVERCMNHVDRKKLIGAVLNDATLSKSSQGYYYYRYGDKKETTKTAEAGKK